VAYNKDQWIESFEGQLVRLRPHLSERVLGAMSNSAWHRHGKNDEDPVMAAKAWAKSLDLPTGRPAR
jgi:hypothetical protein